ncbi:MAG: response regulator transcription factor [Anaerolineales bacterium]|nr:response regulator transcription factor [Anaerolineales bacterium]
MKSKILCVEGKYAGTPVFVEQLKAKGYKVSNALTGKDALASLASFRPQVAVVNAPSMRTTGVRICRALRENRRSLPIILIYDEGKELSVDDVAANEVLALPFTVRKLNNRIKSLLPLQSKNCLKAGTIQLDLEQHQVRCQGRKTHLTPRLTHLLAVLMREPGTVVNRDDLFREVWETDFIEDTRTLDVHISWLRKALEKDPRKPKFLKTLRGVGYRLDV